MLVRRHRRRPNIKSALVQVIVFAGNDPWTVRLLMGRDGTCKYTWADPYSTRILILVF